MRNNFNTLVITNGDMSGDLESPSHDMSIIDGFCVQAIFTGSPVGTLEIQVSLNDTDWETLADSSVAVSGAGSEVYNVSRVFYDKMKVVYTATSGTGTLNVQLNTKTDEIT